MAAKLNIPNAHDCAFAAASALASAFMYPGTLQNTFHGTSTLLALVARTHLRLQTASQKSFCHYAEIVLGSSILVSE